MSADLDDLYQEVLLDHAKSAKRRGKPASACSSAEAFNPLCGDEVSFYVGKKNGRVEAVGYQGQGCAISQASASIAAQAIDGLPLAKARRELEAALSYIKTGEGVKPSDSDWEALGGVGRFPMRVKCATMAVRAALEALRNEEGQSVGLEDAGESM